jgi:hypothetical protein
VKQKVGKLSEEDIKEVEVKRTWVRDHFTPESRHKYESSQEKLRLIDTILKEKWINPNETYKLQCLGITLGDVLEQEIGLRWVVVDDEYGRTPSLQVEHTSILLFPQTMISQRIERGEDVNVYQLLEDARATIDNLVQEQANSF